MPPNRKGAFDAVDTLSTLNVSQFVETSKFAPLTSAPAVDVPQQQDDVTAAVDSVGDVPSLQNQHDDDPVKTATIERILKEEKLRQLFSVDHKIETEINIPHNDGEAKTNTVHREVDATNAEDYWSEAKPNESDLQEAFTIRSKHNDAAYWEWKSPQEEKDALVQRILEEERVRQLFTIEHIEQSLQKEAAKLRENSKTVAVLAPQNDDSYWSWDSKEQDVNDDDIVLRPEDKERIFQEILEAEKLRQHFTIEHVEDIEMKGARNCGVSRTVASNDDYWAGF